MPSNEREAVTRDAVLTLIDEDLAVLSVEGHDEECPVFDNPGEDWQCECGAAVQRRVLNQLRERVAALPAALAAPVPAMRNGEEVTEDEITAVVREVCASLDRTIVSKMTDEELRKRFPEYHRAVRLGAALASPASAARPEVVCLSGSTRFIDLMAVEGWELEKQGKIVLSCHLLPQWYTTAEHHLAEEQGVAAAMDDLHLRKIDMADRVVVVTQNDYIGQSTAREIAYAKSLGKPVEIVNRAYPASPASAEPVAWDWRKDEVCDLLRNDLAGAAQRFYRAWNGPEQQPDNLKAMLAAESALLRYVSERAHPPVAREEDAR